MNIRNRPSADLASSCLFTISFGSARRLKWQKRHFLQPIEAKKHEEESLGFTGQEISGGEARVQEKYDDL